MQKNLFLPLPFYINGQFQSWIQTEGGHRSKKTMREVLKGHNGVLIAGDVFFEIMNLREQCFRDLVEPISGLTMTLNGDFVIGATERASIELQYLVHVDSWTIYIQADYETLEDHSNEVISFVAGKVVFAAPSGNV